MIAVPIFAIIVARNLYPVEGARLDFALLTVQITGKIQERQNRKQETAPLKNVEAEQLLDAIPVEVISMRLGGK